MVIIYQICFHSLKQQTAPISKENTKNGNSSETTFTAAKTPFSPIPRNGR
jgi:hypothetical protein